jgi:predicted DNA-binding transcriptional regulator AlpA
MVSSIGDPEAKGRGDLLRIQRIMDRTGFAEGTVRSKYHAGTFEPVWKLGRHLVAWEADLDAWLDDAKARTTKRPQLRTDDLAGLETLLAEIPDLDALQRLFVREKVIRQMMTETGESREIVTEMIGAADSMDQEAVLALTDGEPTTLRAALEAYLDNVEQAAREDETAKAADVFNDLTAILEFPYPKDLRLELDDEEDETLIIRVNGRDLFQANHDEHGHAGMDAARRAAQAVFDAVAP